MPCKECETCQAWQDMLADITGLPQPSPMGKIRSITRKRADLAQLKNLLPPKLTVSPNSVSNIDQVAAGSFAKVRLLIFSSSDIVDASLTHPSSVDDVFWDDF